VKQADVFQKKGIIIVAISVDNADESRALAERRNLSFSLLSDPGRKVISRYGVNDAEREIV